jgi:predicted AlkP superfamily pyrophosphatase or phosphodiesterase
MRCLLCVVSIVLSSVGLLEGGQSPSGSTPQAQPAAARAADHVFVLMLDGTRPDVLRAVHSPNITALQDAGTRYIEARTIYPSQTRVAFVSMPTGAWTGSHGIVGGEFFMDDQWQAVPLGDEDPIGTQKYCARPTIFEEAGAAGLTSVYAAMKGYELVGARGATWTINGNKTLDRAAYPTRYQPQVNGSAALALWNKERLSRDLLDATWNLFVEKRPNLVVLNLGSADYSAHSFGPDTDEYRQTLEFLDGLIGDLVRRLDDLGVRARTTIIISADHGFSPVNKQWLVAKQEGQRFVIPELTAAGIEHAVTNTGGTSMGIYVRDKARVAEAAAVVRRQPWTDFIYCETEAAHCDRRLSELHAYFPGRSPDLMVDLDDDATVNRAYAGNHGSLKDTDMRIPLILSGAGIKAGQTLGKASLVDVAPTIVKLLGLPGTVLKPDGQVLRDALAP